MAHPRDVVVQVDITPGQVHDFLLPHAGHEEGLEEHLSLWVRGTPAQLPRLGLGGKEEIGKRSAGPVVRVNQVAEAVRFAACL